MKTLVVFYSLEGNTKFIAETVAKQLQADLLEIKPKKAFPTKGFQKYWVGGKSVLLKRCPELTLQDTDLNKYENILFGTPVWAGTFASPLRSFLRQHPIQKKKIAMFACHAYKGAQSAEKCFQDLKEQLAGNTFAGEAEFQDPLKRNREENEKKAVQWALSLSLAFGGEKNQKAT